MAWQTPKTNWGPPDGVRDTDLNRIEGNILELYKSGAVATDATVYVSASGSDATGTGTSAAPFQTITAALASIAKHLNGKNVTLSIASGTYLENVLVKGFTGVLNIVTTGGPVTLRILTVDGCVVNHSGTQLNARDGIVIKNGGVFYGTAIIYVAGGPVGISVHTGSTFIVLQTVTVSNTISFGVEAYAHGRIYVATLGGTGNAGTAISATSGGVVCYGSRSIVATTQQMTNTGGKIYTGAQTSVPNY